MEGVAFLFGVVGIWVLAKLVRAVWARVFYHVSRTEQGELREPRR